MLDPLLGSCGGVLSSALTQLGLRLRRRPDAPDRTVTFSVDGTLIDAWASIKSFRPKDDDDDNDSNGWADFKGQSRKNDTHESKTDPEAKLMRKGRGKEAKLSYSAHALMENRNGLLLDFRVAEANGRAERDVAEQ